jgi:hypothetical protein
MSFSILDLQHRSQSPVRTPAPPPPAPPKIEERIETPEEPAERPRPEEFEFVLGRRQVASLSFVGMVVLMICVAAAYLAGKSTAPKAPPPEVITKVVQVPAPVVIKNEPAVKTEPKTVIDPPLYTQPKTGEVYIQMGAVEKGIAEIFAEGLRKRGLPGVVASGPSANIYRVLIGPLPDPASFVKAKAAVDKIGLSTFARKYPN